jgi:NAD-dependent SIR2 family protein deacetylase
MANPKWFATNPPLAWAFYGHRLNLYRDTIPHDGFKMLLDLVKTKKDNYFIYTSNVDGQFQKAGFHSDKIYEVHGSIHHLQCSNRCTNKIYDASSEYIEVDMDKFEAINIPLCNECGDIARPNILMFGDWSWNSKRSLSQRHKYKNWISNNIYKKIAIIEIGAGTNISTIRNEGNYLSESFTDIQLIRINPRDFEVQMVKNVGIELGGLEGIKQILDNIKYN